jgi:thiol-disulfide isomerase/thioredoxin
MLIAVTVGFFYVQGYSQITRPQEFTLQGKLVNSTVDSVSFEYIDYNGKYTHQIIPVQAGKFIIHGQIDQPSFALLLFKHRGEGLSKRDVELKRNYIYIEPGHMEILAEPDEKKILIIGGSKSQQEWNQLQSQTRPFQLIIDSLSAGTAHPAPASDKSPVLTEALAKLNQVYYNFFVSHPDSYVASDRIVYLTSAFSLDTLKKLYHSFAPAIQQSTGGRRLATFIKTREAGLPGTQAFAFVSKDKDGHRLALEDFKGKYVLLDFWATWCVPCRASMPHMVATYEKYKSRKFEIIAIGDDDTRIPEWLMAIEKDNTTAFHHMLRGANADMIRKGIFNPDDMDLQYGVQSLPTKFLIDPQGKIIGRYTKDEPLDAQLRAIFTF